MLNIINIYINNLMIIGVKNFCLIKKKDDEIELFEWKKVVFVEMLHA